MMEEGTVVGVYTITYENISMWTRVAYVRTARTILPGIRFAMASSFYRLCLVSLPNGHAVCLFS